MVGFCQTNPPFYVTNSQHGHTLVDTQLGGGLGAALAGAKVDIRACGGCRRCGTQSALRLT
jgi:hypothetical protein